MPHRDEITCVLEQTGSINFTMSGQKEALVKLLRDDDPETVRLVKEQLAHRGEQGLGCLNELCHFDDVRVSAHAREVVAEINGQSAADDFSLFCHFFGRGVDLEQACWALARALEPATFTAACEDKINHWGRQLLLKVSGAASNRERVNILTDYVGRELTFRGDCEDYYSEKNSLLPRVVETRAGMPISLSMIYMMIGSRGAMKIEGINLPGHFIARHGEVFFDPFHSGRILTRADIEQILARQGIALTECHLQPATPRQILVRMLSNLLHTYECTGCCEKHSMVRNWMESLLSGRCNG